MEQDLKKLKVAIIHEELTQLGGAERVVDALLELFPDAPIYTLVWDAEKTQHKYDKFEIHTSFIQRLPYGIKFYKWYLALMPLAVDSFRLKKYDLIISSSSALAKGVRTHKNQLHICYCHTPTRWLWSDRESYLKTAPIPKFIKPIMPMVTWFIRKWDLKASKRPNYFIANSHNIQNKIKKYYNRDSDVIYPPVEIDNFHINLKLSDYFLLVTRLEPYKKADLVIKAFNKMPRLKLCIVGGGTKSDDLQKIAGPNISFTGRVSDKELGELYGRARAFIFPQEEDFGITSLEAQAAGRPVIAYRKGGALETVVEGKTGEFFYPQTPEALAKVVSKFRSGKYDPKIIRAHAEEFSKEVFKTKIIEYIKDRITTK